MTNDDLLAAIASDATRWESEAIPRPDLIVVSGDVIQGGPRQTPPSLMPKSRPSTVKLKTFWRDCATNSLIPTALESSSFLAITMFTGHAPARL